MSDKSTFVLSRLEKPDLLLQQNHSDILSRVKSFLPQISAANRILEDNQKAGVSGTRLKQIFQFLNYFSRGKHSHSRGLECS